MSTIPPSAYYDEVDKFIAQDYFKWTWDKSRKAWVDYRGVVRAREQWSPTRRLDNAWGLVKVMYTRYKILLQVQEHPRSVSYKNRWLARFTNEDCTRVVAQAMGGSMWLAITLAVVDYIKRGE